MEEIFVKDLIFVLVVVRGFFIKIGIEDLDEEEDDELQVNIILFLEKRRKKNKIEELCKILEERDDKFLNIFWEMQDL